MRIVVVDDEPDVRLVLSLQLRINGHDVVGDAGDGDEAVQVSEETKPDAVVLDLLMPGMTGLRGHPAPAGARPAAAGDRLQRGGRASSCATRWRASACPLVLKSGDVEPLLAVLSAPRPEPLGPTGRS